MLKRKFCHLETSSIFCWNKWGEKMLKVMQFSWAAYSKPTPACWKELLVLFLLCSCICAISSGLLHNWMFASLKYGASLCNTITCMFTGAVFLLLFLVHPVRCVFTLLIPTIGTKQGRDLLLSTCFMLVAINIISNIMANIKMVLQVLHCVAMTSTKSLMNFTTIIQEVKNVLSADLTTLVDKISESSVVTRSKAEWNINSNSNHSAIKTHLQVVGKEIQSNYFTIQTLLNEITLNTNRVLAGFVFFYLTLTSARYLKHYLTNLQFDNVYITSRLAQLVRTRKGVPIPCRTSSKKLIRSTGLKMSSDEMARCVKQMVISTAYLALSAIVIATDFIVFSLTSQVLLRVADIPPVPVTLEFTYNVAMVYLFPVKAPVSLIKQQADFPMTFIFVSDDCMFQPSPPNIKVIHIVCLLYAIAYVTVFLETYALRVRRKISATFFAQREDERINYLHQKMLKDSECQFENKVAIFTVSEQCNVTFE
ncbi:osteoclast stimulatory transmembrane protein-like [Scyliorhinus canicula]|uniref:osteoclast stimulatory transmembrane protein-like n=1 Tax=Scyliorhinus canicula TaxID=7830 RepID=UPI0018F375AD|nr:osteoclast stimulatory transmembrane protein-like [Scyliorhinus canicula]